MNPKFIFFGFNVEIPVSTLEMKNSENDVESKLQEFVKDALDVNWSVEKEQGTALESASGREQYYLIPESFQYVDGRTTWEEAKKLLENLNNKLGISKSDLFIEPLTDLGFGYEFDGFPDLGDPSDSLELLRKGYTPTEYANDWSVKAIKLDKAWQIKVKGDHAKSVDGRSIRIGLLDTGYTLHPEIGEIEGNFILKDGFDTYDQDKDVTDPLQGFFGGGNRVKAVLPLPGHGTATGSLLNSKKNPKETGTDVLGVAPGAEIIPYRTGESQILTSRDLRGSVTEAINMAADSGSGKCQVLSLSMGYFFGSPEMRKAINEATRKGVIIVAGAGQVPPGGKAPWWFLVKPARYENTVAVAASDIYGHLCEWAVRGDWVDTMAPGMDVWTAAWKKGSKKESITKPSWGTSYATPHVAGIAALWLEMWGKEFEKNGVRPKHKSWLFKHVLKNSLERPVNPWKWGLINAEKVLQYDWREDKWKTDFVQIPTDIEYNWTNELAQDIPGSTYMLRSVSYENYEKAAIQVLMEQANIKGKTKYAKINFEKFLQKRYHVLIFFLSVNKIFMKKSLRAIGTSLELPEDLIFPSDPSDNLESLTESEREQKSEDLWSEILDY